MRYSIHHTTIYNYLEPVSLCHNVLRLAPRNTGKQVCRDVTVKIHPEPDTLREYEDFFGNKVLYFSIEKEHGQLKVEVRSEIEKMTAVPEDRQEAEEIGQFIFETPMTACTEEIAAYARVSFDGKRPVLEAAGDLMHRIYKDFRFTPGFTTISTPLSVVMRERKGVCQDFAHLAIACVRSVGLPARYVSGYIETISPPGVEKLIGVDASHAWFSVYVPYVGWVDHDPTNNVLPGDQHITIGWGRDYADIAPMKGIIISSGHHGLSVSVDVKRLT
ncbi:transglutaminase family protein [Flavitalea sp. BT771]|uniref:transglutaminase family protein n=1 Tax=Flavitalea sp. BT771 TaxID=3063329 RepID=UPI0026E4114A|nr:transglutaminase family protein [Flavitalea sp. BT771]MDO6435663.1 transglutaminase family protein [Flavitalea sp. BT771]MDV6224564.1 transglutaminase family protein [Flavitalea sp. BT771]